MDNLIKGESEILLYSTPEGQIRLEVLIKDETVWLTQQKIAALFGVDRSVITKHLKNIFVSGELIESSVCANFAHTASDGKKYQTKFYNLDAIISTGYRVNSRQATHFRIWATERLKEFIIKGFTIDDERLKQGKTLFGKDYFKQLLERVRSIRSSERRIYQQVTDIFQECSIDYDRDSATTKKFFATVQNRFHYAITGKTAAEIIFQKADASKQNMGLSTWRNSPDGRILKSDAGIAKNYLNEKEIKQLERTVSGYFDYIENLIERRKTFTMAELAESVNKFLNFNEFDVLLDAGKISKEEAENKAGLEYDKFNRTQKIHSDFDDVIQRLKSENL